MRRTPTRRLTLRGRGLFSGDLCTVTIGPAVPGEGWQWRVRGRWHRLVPEHLAPLPRRSRLVVADDVLVLPEHLLAALVICDVDDVRIDVDGGEVPILDGSAATFVRALRLAGLDCPPSPLRVSAAGVTWSGGPAPALARTWIDARHAAAARPLFPGARPDTALVIEGGARRLGARGRRVPQEPAWHKLLDLLGDLGPWRALAPLRGHLRVPRPSHDRNPEEISRALSRGALRFTGELVA